MSTLKKLHTCKPYKAFAATILACSVLVSSMSGLFDIVASASGNFEMVQTFETEAERTNSGLNTEFMKVDGTQGTADIKYVGANAALSGTGSMKATISNITLGHEFAAVSLVAKAPKATLSNPTGIFFRIQADNANDAYIRLAMTEGEKQWGTDTFDLDGHVTCVSTTGEISKGKIPAGFNGYVFVTDYATAISAKLAEGGCPISIMFYGDATRWSNCQVMLDNAGYYNGDASDAALKELAAQIKGEYPDTENTVSSEYQMIQTFDTEAERADSGINQKVMDTYGFTGNAVASYAGADAALSGSDSMNVAIGTINEGHNFAAVSLTAKAPKVTLSDPTGIFFRLKADNANEAYIRLTMTEGALDWGTDTFDLDGHVTCVSTTGEISKGKIPAGFNGYVFVTGFKEAIMVKLAEGGCPISVMFYGDATRWSNCRVVLDNTGYYNGSAGDAALKALATQIAETYPDNKNISTKGYEIIQTFETEADRANSGLNQNLMTANGTDGKGEVSYVDVNAALNDSNSMKLTVGSFDASWDYAAASLVVKAPKPTLADPSGFFFRLKADNTQETFVRLAMTETAVQWGTDTFDLKDNIICVSRHGKVTKGMIPAYFDGYVFVTGFKDAIAAKLATGDCPISIMFYGGAENWKDRHVLMDNVGYYNGVANEATLQDLADRIKTDYPDNKENTADFGFEMFQTFETEAERTNSGMNNNFMQANGTDGTGSINFVGADISLIGTQSMKLTVGDIVNAWDYAAVSLVSKAPKVTLSEPTGIFFRLKAQNPSDTFIRLALTAEAAEWGVDTFDLAGYVVCVSTTGEVVKGVIPKNFDGYVFINHTVLHDKFVANIQTGGCPISIMFYGGAENWKNCEILLDNVGYYNGVVGEEADALTATAELAERIMAVYPENHEPSSGGGGDEPDPDEDLKDEPFMMIQTFDTEEDYAKVSVAQDLMTASGTNGTGSISHRTKNDAISGGGTLRTMVGSIATSWDYYAVKLYSKLPATEIKKTAGIFFRLRSDNQKGAFLRISFSDTVGWGRSTFDMTDRLYCVTMDGEVSHGNLPADFNGYVFVSIDQNDGNYEPFIKNLYNGGGVFDLMMYGASCLADTTLEIDNFGYFAFPEGSEGYADLAQQIISKYPDNQFEQKPINLFNEDEIDPSNFADAMAGRKAKLTAQVDDEITNRVIVWSVTSGEANIELITNGSDGVNNARLKHSCYVNFLDSGKVVIRATLKYQPDVYEEFTYSVLASPMRLSNLINQLKNMLETLLPEEAKILQDALDRAEAVANDPSSTQKDYIAQEEMLKKVASQLGLSVDESAEISLTITGKLTTENGDALSGYTVVLGEQMATTDKDGEYVLKEIGAGRNSLAVYDQSEELAGSFDFNLVVGKTVSMKNNLFTVASDTTSVRLCMELTDDGLTVLQFSESDAITGFVDNGNQDMPGTGEPIANIIFVTVVALGCVAFVFLFRKKKQRSTI